MAHRITYISKYGAKQVGRLYGAPDRDSAAIWIADKYNGSIVKDVEPISDNAARFWGEHDLGRF